ncbi:unnamed protein product [Phytophthora fragariaefolia]|uniref:Unnamed protein product n=1 Tax=Phytophthora fragariaefolia TaxID=1490495 RepID=A0A9W6XTJ5_9STRA|nr:unnamed protein product [Phytophthora fragariaefolia]
MEEYSRKVNTPEARIAIDPDPRVKRHHHRLVTDVAQIKQEIKNELIQNYRKALMAQQQSTCGPPSAKKKRGNELKGLMTRFSDQNGESVPEYTPGDVEDDGDFETSGVQNLSREDSLFTKELDRWLTADEGMSEIRERRYQRGGTSFDQIDTGTWQSDRHANQTDMIIFRIADGTKKMVQVPIRSTSDPDQIQIQIDMVQSFRQP